MPDVLSETRAGRLLLHTIVCHGCLLPVGNSRNDDALDDDENLELHMVDYSIGYNVIYAVFSWSVADEAYELMRSLAQKHKVGFFDVSGDDGDIILPDGIMIK